MIETAAAAAAAVGKYRQLLFAIETLPDGTNITGFKVIDFQNPQGRLRDIDFALVADFLRPTLSTN